LIAYNTAFLSLALFFIAATPFILIAKITIKNFFPRPDFIQEKNILFLMVEKKKIYAKLILKC